MDTSIFKYIFVAIAGLIILLFFVNFAFQHASTEEKISSTILARLIDQNLDAFAISENSNKEINLNLDTELIIMCNSIAAKKGSQVKNQKTIFSPRILKGKIIKAYTKSWENPFKITNFYYLTNKYHNYILIYDQQTKNYVEEVKEKLPERFNINILSINELNKIEQDENTKLIFFNNKPKKLPKVTSIQVIKDTNKIKFLDEKKESYFYSEEFLYGAIFAENHESYECSLDSALDKLYKLYSLYKEKANLLKQKNTDCTTQYNAAITNLNQIRNKKDPQQMKIITQNLEKINKELEDDLNCANLF